MAVKDLTTYQAKVGRYQGGDEFYMKSDGLFQFYNQELTGAQLKQALYVQGLALNNSCSRLSLEQDTVNMTNLKESKLEAITRRDITICPRIYPVAEAMVRIAITDALMMAKGYDSLAHLDDRWKAMGRP